MTVKAQVGVLAAPVYSESDLKSAFVFNFIKFTTWPESAWSSTNASIRVGVVGEPGMVSALERSVAGQSVNGHPIRVVGITYSPGSAVTNLPECHVVYFGSSVAVPDILRSNLTRQPILTIGDSQTFVEDGGCIGLYRRNDKLRFKVNMVALRRSSLQLSSKLLRLADVAQKD